MSDNIKIYIIDFEDSFTFNIASELYTYEKGIKVVSHSDFFSGISFPLFIKNINSPIAIILGPGPGSPEAYFSYFTFINELKNNSQIYLMGICLGHQLLGLLDGLVLRKSLIPMHGEQVSIIFENKNILVQRYNSLAIFDSQKSLNEVQIRHWARGISYQFHPESVGTENRSIFFKDLLNFIL